MLRYLVKSGGVEMSFKKKGDAIRHAKAQEQAIVLDLFHTCGTGMSHRVLFYK